MHVVHFDRQLEFGFEKISEFIKSLHAERKQTEFTSTVVRQNFIIGFFVEHEDALLSCCALYETQLQIHGKNILFFGHFEAKDSASGNLLIHYLIIYCKTHYPGFHLIGPINGSTWNSYRLSLKNEETLFPGDVSSCLFYEEVLTQQGFKIFANYESRLQDEINDSAIERTSNFRIRYFKKEEIISNLDKLYQLSMSAFQHAVLFQEIDFHGFSEKYTKELLSIDTAWMPFVIDENDEIVAYLLAYKAYDADTLVIKTIARYPGREFAGVGNILSEEINRKAKSQRIDKLIHAFMHQNNVSKSISNKYNSKLIKSYGLFQFSI